MAAIRESDGDGDARKIGFSSARLIVKAARKVGISSRNYEEQFNNFATVIWTPVCVWHEDKSGKISHSLMSSLQALDRDDWVRLIVPHHYLYLDVQIFKIVDTA